MTVVDPHAFERKRETVVDPLAFERKRENGTDNQPPLSGRGRM